MKGKSVNPVDTGRRLNVHEAFRKRPGRLLKVLCTFNLRPVSTGNIQFLPISSGFFSLEFIKFHLHKGAFLTVCYLQTSFMCSKNLGLK